MFGEIIVRECPIDNARSDALINAGWKWLCRDWSCPRADICGKHFGLSKRYAEMGEQPANEALVCPTRGETGCKHFIMAKRDYFAESLGQAPRWLNPSNAPSRTVDNAPLDGGRAEQKGGEG